MRDPAGVVGMNPCKGQPAIGDESGILRVVVNFSRNHSGRWQCEACSLSEHVNQSELRSSKLFSLHVDMSCCRRSLPILGDTAGSKTESMALKPLGPTTALALTVLL